MPELWIADCLSKRFVAIALRIFQSLLPDRRFIVCRWVRIDVICTRLRYSLSANTCTCTYLSAGHDRYRIPSMNLHREKVDGSINRTRGGCGRRLDSNSLPPRKQHSSRSSFPGAKKSRVSRIPLFRNRRGLACVIGAVGPIINRAL